MPLSATNRVLFPRSAWKRSFFVTLFFVTLASFLFWLDTFRGYESEVRVLIIGKTESSATEQVIENLAELTSNLSFYERVLVSNDLIDDAFEGQSKDRRKALWNEAVVVRRSENSGVLVVTARQNTSEQSKRLAEETVKTLFVLAPFYYNIKTDVDLRVVDDVIVKPVLLRPLAYILSSIGSALVATIVFFWMLSVTPFFFQTRKSKQQREYLSSPAREGSEGGQGEFAVGASVPYIDPQKFVPARPTALTFESSHQEQQIRQEILAPGPARVTRVEGPVWNERMLPGMDVESLPFEFEERAPEENSVEEIEEQRIPEPVSQKSELPSEPIPTGEPTVEEYKRRLNELLAGGK